MREVKRDQCARGYITLNTIDWWIIKSYSNSDVLGFEAEFTFNPSSIGDLGKTSKILRDYIRDTF